MNKLYLMMLLLLAIACGNKAHEFPDTIYIDPTFSETEQELIIEALDEWHSATNGIVDETPVIGLSSTVKLEDHLIERKYSFNPEIKRLEKRLGKTFTGWAWVESPWGNVDYGPIWLIIDTMQIDQTFKAYEDKFKRTILHELGHHYGLRHDPDGYNTLMEQGGVIKCITKQDLKQFCTIYDCNYKDLKGTCDGN